MCPTRISPMEGRQRVATSSVIDLIEGNAAVPTAASKGLPAHHKFPRVHAAGSYEDYLAAITVAVCEQYPTTAPTRVARRSRHAYRSASVLGGGGGTLAPRRGACGRAQGALAASNSSSCSTTGRQSLDVQRRGVHARRPAVAPRPRNRHSFQSRSCCQALRVTSTSGS